MKEVWKNIEGFEDFYQISNIGRARSVDRIISDKNGLLKNIKGRLLKQSKYSNGYCFVGLSIDGRYVQKTIHRIVSKHFIPNPNNLPEVNHIDENKENNAAVNLEWCTHKYNCNYGTRNDRWRVTAKKREIVKGKNNPMYGKIGKNNPRSIQIVQYDMNGEFISEYDSAACIERKFGYNPSSIAGVAKGRYKQAYGYIWRYKNKEAI